MINKYSSIYQQMFDINIVLPHQDDVDVFFCGNGVYESESDKSNITCQDESSFLNSLNFNSLNIDTLFCDINDNRKIEINIEKENCDNLNSEALLSLCEINNVHKIQNDLHKKVSKLKQLRDSLMKEYNNNSKSIDYLMEKLSK